MNATINLEKKHFPVLLNELISIISPLYGGTFIDCTFGEGGYSKKILENKKNKVLAIDRDKDVYLFANELEKKYKKRFKFTNIKFSKINNIKFKRDDLRGIVFDLGYSFNQIKNLNKGLSFHSKGKLNMQMGLNDFSALEVVNNLEQKNLELIFKVFAEEKDSKNAAAAGGVSFYVSFSDIISVLLCFFILFFAMGKVDGAKAAKLASTFTEKVTQKKPVYNAYVSEEEFTMMEKVKELVLDNVKPEDIIGSKTKTVSHIISGSDLFYPGETVLSEEGKNLLKSKFKKEKVGEVKELIIEGHTDDKEFFEFPEISKKFENNTELSAARAISVVEIIEKILHLSGEIVGIRAYGSNRPLKPNTTDLNRALNRRVVIQIITEVTKKKIFTNNETSKPKNEQKNNNQNLKNTKTT